MLPGQRACQSLTKRWLVTGCNQSGITNRTIMPGIASERASRISERILLYVSRHAT